MRLTLAGIIGAVRDGERPDYEDLRYAICAMEALAVFNQNALMKLAQAETEGKKPFLTSSAVWQSNESFARASRAMNKPPKEYVGWNNDPTNASPTWRTRTRRARRI